MWLCDIRMGSDRTVERGIETNLGEADVGRLLTEALTADVHLKTIRVSHKSPCHVTYCNMQYAPGIGFSLRRTCGSDRRGGSRHG